MEKTTILKNKKKPTTVPVVGFLFCCLHALGGSVVPCVPFSGSPLLFPALALRRVCGRYRGLWRGVPFSCYYKSD